MKLLLIDNYDSFTYNLAHYLDAMDLEVSVRRNDSVSLSEVADFDLIVISPGPGLPAEAGISKSVIAEFHQAKPILGVCLGAQALAEYFGAELYNQKEVAHGIRRNIIIKNSPWLYQGLNGPIEVGLYHSWAIQPKGKFAAEFICSAERDNGVLMAFEHPQLALAGIQYHPESIMTDSGKTSLNNWVNKAKEHYAIH